VLTDVVATVVAEVNVTAVIVPVSSGDVTESEVDERVDYAGGRSKILSRRTIGLLFGLLIVTDNGTDSAVICTYSAAASGRTTTETASQHTVHS